MQTRRQRAPEIEIGRELALHTLEYRILGSGLSASSQRFRSCAAERRRDDAGDAVLDSDAERADEFTDEVQRVRRHCGVGDVGTILECDGSTLGQALTQLTKNFLVPVLAKPYHLKHVRASPTDH